MDFGCDHFYVTLFSNASIDLYPDNTRAVFTTHLAHPIDLGTSSSEWEVGLCEISYGGPSNELVTPNTSADKTMVFVYCDLVAPQFVADQNLRTLRIIHFPSVDGEHLFQNVYYLLVEKRVFQDINIQMRLMDGSTVPFEPGILPVKMVLHFRRAV